jgi:hypothetical protein
MCSIKLTQDFSLGVILLKTLHGSADIQVNIGYYLPFLNGVFP